MENYVEISLSGDFWGVAGRLSGTVSPFRAEQGTSLETPSRLNIWKFMVHVLLKPGLENFEHYFTRM